MSDYVWYASYGSNLFESRFACYLQGGQPPGASRIYPGARDRTPPTAVRPLSLRGNVFFGWASPTWGGGGVAFLDPDRQGQALARAYRITAAQFADVLTQEMHREHPIDLDLTQLRDRQRWELGGGRYETVWVPTRIDDEIVVTFTCPGDERRPNVNPPTAPYLRMIAAGLRESHQMGMADAVAYLEPLEGVRGFWSADSLAAALQNDSV
ncbi:hypothetical protein [Demetria terragena]|uniref:hypothetical protein n=1 Tax=Demetria terragena TaxID=63959 RepID=UPI00036F566F|nr:hypothetical protein [Demetria terragena]